MTDMKAREVSALVFQALGKSERGRQALRDFKALLDNGGYGLDVENWQAMITLCQLAAHGKGFALEEQFTHTTAPERP